ncbi:MAG: alginate lyase family protein [Verrucomicrobia bacterium]|nr:alginate lyase family protein [Verrucomicrobiota bacterium]
MRTLSSFLLFAALLAGPVVLAEEPSPRFFGAPPGALAKTKARLATGDKTLQPALKKLVEEADGEFKLAPPSVMQKAKPAPSGDKHDYFSTAPYFWPDPEKKDGLPYIRKDGKVNPESHNEASDSPRQSRMSHAAETLALAYYFTGKEVYAEKAARLLRVWFLDAETKMNPNFNFAQAVPGVNNGRGTGMIESRGLALAADAASLLVGSKHWSQSDHDALVAWMRAFLEWTQTSKNGQDEHNAKNNHGSFYDMQVAHFALFVGQTNLAKQIIESAKERRIAVQFKPDGSQPLELTRADSFGYSRFNLQALFALSTLGEHVGADVWHYKTTGGADLRKGLDFLLPYAEDLDKPWPYEHSKKNSRSLNVILRPAYAVYGDERYLKLIKKSRDSESQRDILFFPAK